MPVFAALGKATEYGLRNLQAFGVRHERAVQRAEQHGGKIIASYVLLGQYDYLVILEAPDVKTAIYILTREAASGNIRYETMAALPIEEFARLVQD